MNYSALAVGVADELMLYLQNLLTAHDLHFESVPTVQEASRRLSQKKYYLLIIDLEYLENIGQISWLECIRCTSFMPLIVLSNSPERDNTAMIQLGADICISQNQPWRILADMVFALFRRYTQYNRYYGVWGMNAAPFRVGDIDIDPARHTVQVRGEPVKLRPREFSLLLYFMRNPKIVLTANQICENAWGTDGIYVTGIGQPVRMLRQAIEPDPQHPVYIETVRLVGYRFTAKKVEYCDVCDDSVI